MPSHAELIAGKQPDGTQGIATVELKTGNNDPTKLLGCAIHVSKKDKSLRNILKVEEEKHSKVKYFILVPWFHCRPTGMNENSTKIDVKLHRFNKEEKKKTFPVNESNSKEILDKYCSDDYLVIPCPESRNFRKSSFLKDWSSELLLHNNSGQVLQSSNLFHGFKKDTGNTLFKYCGVDQESDQLEKQGVLLIQHSTKKSYVVGCYKKENGSTEKYCFLLKGLEKIAEQSLPEGSEEGSGDNPDSQQPPPGSGAGGSNIPTPQQPPPGSGTGESNIPTPQQPPPRSGAGGSNIPTPQQPPPGSGAGGSNIPTSQQPPPGSGAGGSNIPTSQQPPPGSGAGGSNIPTSQQPPPGSGAGGSNIPTSQQPPPGSGAGGSNIPTPQQPPPGSSAGGSNIPTSQQPPPGSGAGGSNIPTPQQPPPGSGAGGSNIPTPQQPPPRSGAGGSNIPTPQQPPPGRNGEERDSPQLDQRPLTSAQGSQGNSGLSQECEDGRITSTTPVVSGRQSSVASNCEDEREKILKRELIHKTYGPTVDKMPYDVQHKVGLMLNCIQKAKGNDYRMVASRIDMNYHEIHGGLPKENPMEGVFEVMCAKAIKVDKFVVILFEIDRGDVVDTMYEMALQKSN